MPADAMIIHFPEICAQFAPFRRPWVGTEPAAMLQLYIRMSPTVFGWDSVASDNEWPDGLKRYVGNLCKFGCPDVPSRTMFNNELSQ